METLTKKVNAFQPFTIFTKNSILDVGQGTEYVPALPKLLFRGSKIREKFDIYQTEYNIHWKLKTFPYSEVIHGSITFKLTKG